MIEINLLPGAKKKRGAGARFQMPDLKQLAGVVKDPWLIALVAGWVLVAGVILLFYIPRQHQVQGLEPKLVETRHEAARLQEVLATQGQAQKVKDSLEHQIGIIRTIDRERYVWPHIMDAITKALPEYTWVDEIAATGGGEVGAVPAAGDTSSGAAAVSIQITGKSGDIQAVTRFVRNLEESPFLEGATQVSTQVVTENNRDVYNYVIRVHYQNPDSTLLTMEPLAASLVQSYRSGAVRPSGR
jgi:Tfp pilus assembly protein PilN